MIMQSWVKFIKQDHFHMLVVTLKWNLHTTQPYMLTKINSS